MRFWTDGEYQEFAQSTPEFERMLIRSGIVLIKYWFSISADEQEPRFQKRSNDPKRRWKLPPLDLEARERWVEYSRSTDVMFTFADTEASPWSLIYADIKRHARLNCLSHLLSQIEDEDTMPGSTESPERQEDPNHGRPAIDSQNWVPALCGSNPPATDVERS